MGSWVIFTNHKIFLHT